MKGIKTIYPFIAVILSLTISGCKSGDGNWFERTEWNAIGVVANFSIAAAGFFIAHRIRKVQEERDRLEAFDGYRRELGSFADAVIDAMGEIQTLIAFNPDHAAKPKQARQQFVEQRSRLISVVSSLIERGRFFFPNQKIAGIGEHKGSAQQGLREPVLNRIMAAHHVLLATDFKCFKRNSKRWIDRDTLTTEPTDRERHVCSAFRWLSLAEQSRLAGELKKKGGVRLMDLIISAKRGFVSEVFSILQPDDWLKQVEGAYGIELLSRKREGPALRVEFTEEL